MANVFYEKPYNREIQTRITGVFEEEGKQCVQVEDSIFHPHGGGQKGDKGALILGDREIPIFNTVKDKYSDEGDVLLIAEGVVPPEVEGQQVVCRLDWDFRYRQMRLHTAVHLHHCMLERMAGKSLAPPKTSDIQDRFAFNRYESDEISPELVELANGAFRNAVGSGAAVKTYPDTGKKGFRWWECLDFKIPCGGTHVADIAEVGDVEIQYSKKGSKPTVTITLR